MYQVFISCWTVGLAKRFPRNCWFAQQASEGVLRATWIMGRAKLFAASEKKVRVPFRRSGINIIEALFSRRRQENDF